MPRGRPKGSISREREVTCECGTPFLTRHSMGRYCSEPCRRLGWRRMWREYGARNRERRSDYHRDYYLAFTAKINARIRRYNETKRGKAVRRVADVRQHQRFPERVAARRAVNDAVQYGSLIPQPCEKCGATKVQGHHEDYMKPLEVNWLCTTHHVIADRARRAREQAKIIMEDGHVVEASDEAPATE